MCPRAHAKRLSPFCLKTLKRLLKREFSCLGGCSHSVQEVCTVSPSRHGRTCCGHPCKRTARPRLAWGDAGNGSGHDAVGRRDRAACRAAEDRQGLRRRLSGPWCGAPRGASESALRHEPAPLARPRTAHLRRKKTRPQPRARPCRRWRRFPRSQPVGHKRFSMRRRPAAPVQFGPILSRYISLYLALSHFASRFVSLGISLCLGLSRLVSPDNWSCLSEMRRRRSRVFNICSTRRRETGGLAASASL